MRVTFVSNYINHHQIPISTVLYEKWGADYHFIQTEPMEEERIRLGWNADNGGLPYLLQYADKPEECKKIIQESDVVIFGGTDDESYIQERLQSGKIVVRYSERLYKEGQWKAVSPRGLRKKYLDHTRYQKSQVYLLCAGGYVADDFEIIRAYRGKRFKWGYFPEFEESTEEERCTWKKSDTLQLLWAGRFIDWKHPMDVLVLAKRLKENGYVFTLTMAGGGELEDDLKRYVSENGLKECVKFVGFCKPERVRELMKQAHIFFFTSDYKEGWGAVLNEAMNSGCAVIASHAIGAVPFLLKNKVNGLIYRSGHSEELFELTESLIKDTELRERLGAEAYKTIQEEWNPKNAGQALIELCESLIKGKFSFKQSGPLSEAPVIKQRKMYKFLCK